MDPQRLAPRRVSKFSNWLKADQIATAVTIVGAIVTAVAGTTLAGRAQQPGPFAPKTLTRADYARAERTL